MPVRLANNDFPVLDGVAPSWADVIVRASPVGAPLIETKDISAINTGATVEVGEQRRGGRVYKRTTGSSSYEASMTLYYSGWTKLISGLVALAPVRGNQRIISLVHFGLQVQYTPPGSAEIFEYRVKGCRILGRTINGAEGNDATSVEVALSTIEIVDMIGGREVVIL